MKPTLKKRSETNVRHNMDAATKDTEMMDTEMMDTEMMDTEMMDTATKDAAMKDTGMMETGMMDTATKDAATKDTGTTDGAARQRAMLATAIAERTSGNRAVTDVHEIEVDGRKFVVYPHVFSPAIFKDCLVHLRHLRIEPGQSFLEMGCGAGLMAVTAALGGASRVAASDINPHAVANTRANAALHGVSDRLQVYEGSVFEPIPEGERFDVIFWNLPYVVLNDAGSLDHESRNVQDPGYVIIERYFQHGRRYLTPQGRLMIGFSSTIGDPGLLEALLERNGLRRRLLYQKVFHNLHGISLEGYELSDRN